MKVSELIQHLSEMPQDAIVVMSQDGEGNGFRLMDDAFCEGVYDKDEHEYYHEDDIMYLEEEEDASKKEIIRLKTLPACVVVWPR